MIKRSEILITSLVVVLISISCTKRQIRKNACIESGFITTWDSCGIFVNNLFTPNGDGKTDHFPMYCDCPGASDFNLDIEKGSKLIFSSTNPVDVLWDGTFNGGPAKEGVYSYSLDLVLDGESMSFDGTITLIRDISEPILIENTGCLYDLSDPIVIE